MTTDQVYCAQRDRDTRSVDADSVPLKSRYEKRRASKKKSQEAYGRRRWSKHAEWVSSQLECHRMNEESLSPSSSTKPSEHCWVRLGRDRSSQNGILISKTVGFNLKDSEFS